MRLMIADPTLRDFAGHSFESAVTLSERAAQRGYRCTTLAVSGVSVEVTREMTTVPCFSYHADHLFRLPVLFRLLPPRHFRYWQGRWNQWVHGRFVLQDLKAVEAKLRRSGGRLVPQKRRIGVFVHSLHDLRLRGVQRVARALTEELLELLPADVEVSCLLRKVAR